MDLPIAKTTPDACSLGQEHSDIMATDVAFDTSMVRIQWQILTAETD